MTSVVDRRDLRWNDAAWRTETLLALIADHRLTSQEIATMTGRSVDTVRQWRSGKSIAIPIVLLRLLMLDLAYGGRNGL